MLITPELNDTDPIGHIARWLLERDVHLRPAAVFVEEHEPLATMTGILASKPVRVGEAVAFVQEGPRRNPGAIRLARLTGTMTFKAD